MPTHIIRIALVEFLVLGVVFLLAYGFTSYSSARPELRRWFGWVGSRRLLSIVLVGILATAINAGLARIQMPVPSVHDEFSYLLAAETFLHGRVANPTHPMWVHFETFYVLQQPTYASMYPPGQGVLLALGTWLVGHPFVGVCLGVGLASAAVCWMLQGWLPARWALLGGLMTACHTGLQIGWGHKYWGGTLAMIGAALLFGAWPRVMRTARVRDSLVIACGAVILAISRSFEGFVVCLPVALSLILWLVTQRSVRLFVKVALPAAAVLLVAGTALARYNAAITGNPWLLPAQAWAQQYSMRPIFLWQDVREAPEVRHEEIQQFTFRQSQWEMQQDLRGFLGIKSLQFISMWSFFWRVYLSLPLVALPWIARSSKMRWIIFVVVLLSAASSMVAWLLPHYWAPIFPLVFLLSLQGFRHWKIVVKRRAARWQHTLFCASIAAYFLVAAVSMTLFALRLSAPPAGWVWDRARIEQQLESTPELHLVVVQYGPDHSYHNEWIRNRANIDEAKIVWARDMGEEQNQPLLHYFSDRKAWRLQADERPPRLEPYHSSPRR